MYLTGVCVARPHLGSPNKFARMRTKSFRKWSQSRLRFIQFRYDVAVGSSAFMHLWRFGC